MGLAGHRIRPCYLGDWGAPISGGRGDVRFKATAPGSLCRSLKNKIDGANVKQGHTGIK